MDLVAKHAVQDVGLLEAYYDVLSARLLDKGVSVRKRILKFLREVCSEAIDLSLVADACGKIVRRLNDEEESIQDLVVKYVQDVLFAPIASSSDESTHTMFSRMPVGCKKECQRRIQILVRLIEGGISSETLSDLFRRILSVENASEIQDIFNVLIGCLMDSLVGLSIEGNQLAELSQITGAMLVLGEPFPAALSDACPHLLPILAKLETVGPVESFGISRNIRNRWGPRTPSHCTMSFLLSALRCYS